MNYNKVIKDLKERNNTLANQYRLRDIRCINLEQENERLKKQLNELQKPQIFIDTQDIEERYGEELYQTYLEEKVETLKGQQQKFINYLEDEIKRIATLDETKISQCSITIMRCIKNDYKEILQKYKSIIGGKNENNLRKAK